MKRFYSLLITASFLVTGWVIFSSHTDGVFGVYYSGGPAASGLDRTGGPLSPGGQTCSACHSGGTGSTSITFELRDANNVPVTTYVPGASYTARYQVTSTQPIKGFQSVALRAGNLQAGTFTTVLSTQSTISTLAGRQYPEHQGSSGSGLFQFTWVAPIIGTGNVTFYSTGNGVNGNGGTSGDTPSSAISAIITEGPAPTTISYSSPGYCNNGTDPTPTITGASGGTFNATPTGLSINSTTGQIDVSASTPGTYTVTYTYATGVATKTVKINPVYNMNNTASICSNDSIFLAGAWQDSPGIYTTNLLSISGCDSIVNTTLIIKPVSSSQSNATICQGDSVLINGQYKKIAGTYSSVYTNSVGCDSTASTTLNVNPSYNQSQTASICLGDSILFGGNYYSTAGTYTNAGQTSLGCDSIVVLNLTVFPINLGVTNTSPSLTALQNGASYQWLDCANNYAPIAGATSQTFTATSNGQYAVEVTTANCTDTSACEIVSGIGLAENQMGEIKLYPNPSKGKIFLEGTFNGNEVYEIVDFKGKSVGMGVLNGNAISTSQLTTGVYLLNISSENKMYRLKFSVQ